MKDKEIAKDNTFIPSVLLLALSLLVSACTVPQISPTVTTTSTAPSAPEVPVNTLTPTLTRPAPTRTMPSAVQPLPDSLEVLYLRTDGQIALTDLSGTKAVGITPVLTQTAPGDEPNVWLQLYLYTPPVVSPDGNRLLLPDGSGGWLVYDLAGQSILKQFSATAAILSPSFSPEGERLAFIQEGRLCLYSLTTDSSECLPSFETAPLFAGWSPYSDRIAVVVGECCKAEVWMVDTATFANQPIDFTDLTFETNLNRLLLWVYDGSVGEEKLVILSQNESSQALIYSPLRSSASQLNFALAGISPDGRNVLTLDGRVGTAEGDFFHALAAQSATVLLKDWAWSPQNDRLAVIYTPPDRADAATLSVIDLSEKNLLWKRTFNLPLARVAWSRDASILLLDQADLRPTESPVWKIAVARENELEILVEAGFLIKVLH